MRWAVLPVLLLLVGAESAVAQTPGVVPRPPDLAPEINSSTPVPHQVKPIFTRQDSFTIPFQVDGFGAAGRPTAEVSLYVSADQGANWTQYQRQPPAARRFEFRAGNDGEYWFAIRSFDQPGQVRPAGRLHPEMRVIVDTVAPNLDLTAEIGSSGEIRSQWKAFDQNLAPRSFRLQYRANAGAPWQAVAVESANPSAPRNQLAGQANWYPHEAVGSVELRAEVRDTAGNAAVLNRRLRLPQAAVASQPTASEGLGSMAAPDETAGSPPTPPRAEVWHSQPTAGSLPVADRQYEEITKLGSRERVTSSGGTAPTATLASDPDAATSRQRPVSGPVHPPIADLYRGDALSVPPGTRPRMSRSPKFQLDYDVQEVDVSEVERVELWVTHDGGRTWKLAMEDADKQSPILVEVEEEGVYGYRLLVYSTDGLAGQPPQPGELADVWVGVDWSAPTASITSARYGTGPKLGELQITWEADDGHLSSRPVTLEFSAHPEGPWSTIAAGLPNTGRYDWRVDPRVPRQFYLRLEVRDEAGNVATDQLDEPISSAGLTPQGRIRQVRPVEP